VSFMFRRSTYLLSSQERLNKNEVVMLNVEGTDLSGVEIAEAGSHPAP